MELFRGVDERWQWKLCGGMGFADRDPRGVVSRSTASLTQVTGLFCGAGELIQGALPCLVAIASGQDTGLQHIHAMQAARSRM